MSKPKEKVPFSMASSVIFDLTDAEWQKLEAAYGQKVASPVRERILKTSRHYLSMAGSEMAAGPMAEAVKRAERLRKAARFLLTLIEQNSNMAPDAAALYADEEIGWFLCGSVLLPSRRREYLKRFGSEISSFLTACDSALDEMSRSSWPHGWAWKEWITAIRHIMKTNGLPVRVRKDTDKNKSGRPSAFVEFIRELQGRFPKSHRRHDHSPTALTVAINRARWASSGHETRSSASVNDPPFDEDLC
jgi:hypothetical protein